MPLCDAERVASEPKQGRLWLPVLPGEVAAIAASDAECHYMATESPLVRHRATSTCCAQRCDHREVDKKTSRFYECGDVFVWAAGRSVTLVPAVGTAQAVSGCKDKLFLWVSILSGGDLGNTPSVHPTTSRGTPQRWKKLKEAPRSALEGMLLLLGQDRDGDGGPASGFAGAAAAQPQEYCPFRRVLVLTSLNSDSTAAFLEPNAIKKWPMESGT